MLMSLTAEQSTKTLLARQWLDCGAAEALEIGEIPWVAAIVPAALGSDLRSDETCSSVTSRVGFYLGSSLAFVLQGSPAIRLVGRDQIRYI